MKFVLITGGVNGLGRFLVDSFFEIGFKIIVWDLVSPSLIAKDFSEKVEKYVQVDLVSPDEIQKVVLQDNIYKQVEIIINNAAIRKFDPLGSYSYSGIKDYVNVNYLSPIEIIRLFLPIMMHKKYGRIINISSISAFQSYKLGNLYISTKLGLVSFTRTFAKELNNNITINAICPDSFQKRDGEKLDTYNYIIEKIRQKILFLIESNVNGKVFIVAKSRIKIKQIIKNLMIKYV